MKIAYLILAHNQPLHLSRLIAALQTEDAYIFLHIDKKAGDMICPPVASSVTLIQNTVTVNWGGFSIVQATLNLMQEAAASGEYDYFILLSGADYPLRSNAYILRFLQRYEGREFMNLYTMPEMNKTFDRVEYFYLEKKFKFAVPSLSKRANTVMRELNKLLRSPCLKRSYPQQYAHFTLYAGSQWWALSKACVDYLLQFVTDNSQYVDFYKHTAIPDEMFFHTIIGNSPIRKHVVNAVVYDDWITGAPAAITLQHLPILSQKTIPAVNGGKMTPLFARKFSDGSQEVITEIDHLFRNDEQAEAKNLL